MKDIIRIGMNVEKIENGIGVEFGIKIHKILDEILTKKEMEEVEGLISKISKIVNKSIKREVELEAEIPSEKEMVKEAVDKTSNELYERLSEEDKKKVDELNKELEKCDSIEEAILLAIKAIKDELK